MKTALFLLFVSIGICSNAQNSDQTERLMIYGQVWGFLKYFHPTPSQQNWDEVLLSDYTRIVQCENNEQFNSMTLDLVDKCGSYNAKSRNIPDSLLFNDCFAWIDHPLIANDLKYKLNELRHNKPEFNNKYIHSSMVGTPTMKNEIDYDTFRVDPAINYLALTRYWNVINYFYPNRDLIPEDWNTVYEESISSFHAINSYEDYYFAIRKLTTELNDGHGFIRTKNDPLSSYKRAPFFCSSFEEGVFIKYVWQDSLKTIDLQKEDRIVAIDGMPIDQKWEEISNYLSVSNDYYLKHSTFYLTITPNDSMSLTIDRNGTLLNTKVEVLDKETFIQRYSPQKKEYVPVRYELRTDSLSQKKYMYVNLASLERKDINRRFKKMLKSTDDVVIDVRNYPNWTILKLGKVLLKGPQKFALFTKMEMDYPGSYTWTKSQSIGGKKEYQGKIYILVDYMTMSQAEYTVMGLQLHPKSVVIGGQTAGADGNITEILLPFGINSVYSGLGVHYPDGTEAQQVGVKVDYPVTQDKSYIFEKNDKILNEAIRLIRNAH